MGYVYVREEEQIRDKSDSEKRMELITSVRKAKKDLENANRNYEYAEGPLIDYYLYEIKANKSKLDYLIAQAKEMGISVNFENKARNKIKKVV